MKKCFQLLWLICASGFALACIWDEDTLEMEKRRFPEAMELITGKFLRHSPEFYQWRIKDREAKLKVTPKQWSYYDDLAVAYAKLHNHAKAIELMWQKEKLYPHQYETYANLGTFYIHDKQYKKGLEYIKKAIVINPNAHFGREVYQQYLVEYVLGKRQNGKTTLPLDTSNQTSNFYNFLSEKTDKLDVNPQEVINGVLGMIKFGNHDSPILLEALGDLLAMNVGLPENATRLAYFAYQKAAIEAKDNTAKKMYHKKMAVLNQDKPEQLDKLLAQSIQEGKKFYQQIRNNEMRWIAEGKNPEKEFAQKYYKKATHQPSTDSIPYFAWLLVALAGVALVWFITKRKR
ncbi:hypothetical protein [Microscilla marina]|uniref:Tetratricopeptide repeat domain protein n=1 Tax=Microscilla marina ATCC 23134 TaxID=313606 RepID=A1ZWJ3_MICM2|nr:hypothetical protein [Microscilla marina]EAY25233.1 tetratricopeptide repeat domain protein [Microscilla marina ATCC 23134]